MERPIWKSNKPLATRTLCLMENMTRAVPSIRMFPMTIPMVIAIRSAEIYNSNWNQRFVSRVIHTLFCFNGDIRYLDIWWCVLCVLWHVISTVSARYVDYVVSIDRNDYNLLHIESWWYRSQKIYQNGWEPSISRTRTNQSQWEWTSFCWEAVPSETRIGSLALPYSRESKPKYPSTTRRCLSNEVMYVDTMKY